MIEYQQRRDSLKKLADYLYNLPENYSHFHMGVYFEADYEGHQEDVLEDLELYDSLLHSCGTSACALGHGPAAGVNPYGGCGDWDDYALFNFGIKPNSNAWKWLFSPYWDSTINAEDNTPKAAALRIYQYLESDVPQDFVCPQTWDSVKGKAKNRKIGG